jgi:hypothetical protein
MGQIIAGPAGGGNRGLTPERATLKGIRMELEFFQMSQKTMLNDHPIFVIEDLQGVGAKPGTGEDQIGVYR